MRRKGVVDLNQDNTMLTAQIFESTDFIISKAGFRPDIGLITGTGLGGSTDKMEVELRLPYDEIPHFPASTTQGHTGILLMGVFGGRPAVAMQGRFHPYEGYTCAEVTFPVRVMAKLGVKALLISSAAGGLNPHFLPGDLMIVTDHINLTGMNPLTGPNLDSFGPRFPDMSDGYDKNLIHLARNTALDSKILLREGVYVGVLGPSLETPAETRFLRWTGADAVGMSTVLEVIAGVHCGLKVMVIVAITNVNLPDCMGKTSIEEVIARASKTSKSLAHLWEKIVLSPGFGHAVV